MTRAGEWMGAGCCALMLACGPGGPAPGGTTQAAGTTGDGTGNAALDLPAEDPEYEVFFGLEDAGVGLIVIWRITSDSCVRALLLQDLGPAPYSDVSVPEPFLLEKVQLADVAACDRQIPIDEFGPESASAAVGVVEWTPPMAGLCPDPPSLSINFSANFQNEIVDFVATDLPVQGCE